MRLQLKSKGTVDERLLASNKEAVTEYRLILLKGQQTIFYCLISKLFIWKKISVMEFLASTQCTKGALQTVRSLCEPIILSIGNLEILTEVQLNSW